MNVRTKLVIDWVKDYFKDLPEAKAIVGLTGDKDSAVVAGIIKEALGADRLLCVFAPDSSDCVPLEVLMDFLEVPECNRISVNLRLPLESLASEISDEGLPEDIKKQMQDRLLLDTICVLKCQTGARIACTVNFTELCLGFFTKFCTECGDFAPLADLQDHEVIFVGKDLGLPDVFMDEDFIERFFPDDTSATYENVYAYLQLKANQSVNTPRIPDEIFDWLTARAELLGCSSISVPHFIKSRYFITKEEKAIRYDNV